MIVLLDAAARVDVALDQPTKRSVLHTISGQGVGCSSSEYGEELRRRRHLPLILR